MKSTQANTLDEALTLQLQGLGATFSRLRIARKVRQGEAAARAGISRTTASSIENGSPSVAIGQLLRYLDAIAPGKTMAQLMAEPDQAVLALSASERRSRARTLSAAELKELDF